MTTKNTKSLLDSPRVRFNWGFHDATAEAARGRVRDVSRHFDRTYAAGYAAGVRAMQGTTARPESSDSAWAERAS
jgi:hypothetical protein